MPALSGVLITAGYRMLDPSEIKHVLSLSPLETIPAGVTFATLLVSGDLLCGVGLGFLASLGLNHLRPEGRLPLTWILSADDGLHTQDHVPAAPTSSTFLEERGKVRGKVCSL